MVSWRSSNWKLESHGKCLDVSGFFVNTWDGFGYILDCFGCLEIHCNVSFKTMGLFFFK